MEMTRDIAAYADASCGGRGVRSCSRDLGASVVMVAIGSGGVGR